MAALGCGALQERLLRALDAARETIFAIGQTILENPELGYAEHKTSALVRQRFEALGLPVQAGLGITGVKAVLDTGRPGPCVAIMGELDAVISHGHPCADRDTGAAHACGHNAQIAVMLGVAEAFVKSGVAQEALCGRVCFFAVPAEEYGEIDKRLAMRSQGKISWLGGKQELLARGHLDDIDIAMMIHASTDGPVCHVGQRGMGFVGKNIRFVGREAHAGGAPDQGINALNAAMAALMLIHANRETFRDEDGVRVHPIITRGGDLVNVVPADVRMETYVRAWETDAMQDAARKVDRALEGAAYGIGARVEIETIPGYLPLRPCAPLDAIFADAARTLPLLREVTTGGNFPGSTDMGDLSAVMPTLHPTIGGFEGAPHSKEYHITDPELAYIAPAQALALTAYALLEEDAKRAREVMDAFPRKSFDDYKRMWDSLLA